MAGLQLLARCYICEWEKTRKPNIEFGFLENIKTYFESSDY